MNKELELEANEYATQLTDEDLNYLVELSGHVLHAEIMKDFISGATSKWVEKQKLEFAIEQLKEMDNKMKSVSDTSRTVLLGKIEQLEQKLSEL